MVDSEGREIRARDVHGYGVLEHAQVYVLGAAGGEGESSLMGGGRHECRGG